MTQRELETPMPPMTLDQFCAHCMHVGQGRKASHRRYAPSAKQVTFFGLVWASKQGMAVQALTEVVQEDGRPCTIAEIHEQTALIAMHLDEDGEQVANLKRRHAHEWELLRIQFGKSVRAIRCPAEWKDDAISMALIRMLALLDELPRPRDLEGAHTIFEFASAWQAPGRESEGYSKAETGSLGKLYRFDRVFVAYAVRTVVNKLRDLLRSADHFTEADLNDEIMAERLQAPDATHLVGEQEELREIEAANVARLSMLMKQLMLAIEAELTPSQRKVMVQTLAARPQFWRVLKLAGREPPKGIEPPQHEESDAEIGARLGMTENAVRVHRAGAKKRLKGADPVTDPVTGLARLLEVLLDARSGVET